MIIHDSFRRKDFREAADAGILLWRQNIAAFMPFFAIPFLICALALRLFPEDLKYLSWLIIWLLKPLFDRIILHIISVRFFETGASLKRLWQGMGKSMFRGLTGDILWRRFSPLRSVMMPVRVLERNINSARGIAERRKLLENGGIGYGFLLTVWGIAVEIALLTGGILFFITMTELISGSSIYFLGSIAERENLIFFAWCINIILVETIYVCMGFSLYINSRIEVEGWDIEITFRNLAEKLKDKSKIGAKYPPLFFLMAACLFLPAKIYADTPEISPAPLETLQAILESPDFGGEEDSWGIRLKNPPQPRDIPEYDPELTQRLQRILAYTLRFFLIVIAAAMLVFLFIYLKKYRQNRFGVTDNPSVKTFSVNTGDDPNLLLEKALNFYKSGQTRLAWGYCTAAAIQSWPHYRGIIFPPDATESDCAYIVGSLGSGSFLSDAFSRLIKNWEYLAYAGRFPPEGCFEEAVSRCRKLRTENG